MTAKENKDGLPESERRVSAVQCCKVLVQVSLNIIIIITIIIVITITINIIIIIIVLTTLWSLCLKYARTRPRAHFVPTRAENLAALDPGTMESDNPVTLDMLTAREISATQLDSPSPNNTEPTDFAGDNMRQRWQQI